MFENELSDFLGSEAHILSRIWLSDEAHFHSDGYKQNAHYKALQIVETVIDSPLHAQQVTVWCGVFSSICMFGPVFVEDTVSSQVYLNILENGCSLSYGLHC